MKQALLVMSWIAIVVGALALIGGLTTISSDPENSYYALLGGLMFFVEGLIAVIYVNDQA